jgi:hypothetical protein
MSIPIATRIPKTSLTEKGPRGGRSMGIPANFHRSTSCCAPLRVELTVRDSRPQKESKIERRIQQSKKSSGG